MSPGRKEKRFAEWLDVTLSNKKILGRDLAEAIGVHESAVSRWRSGKSVPSMDDIPALAGALDVDALRLAVTAGKLPLAMLDGQEPLPMPEPTARRESVKRQIANIRGLTRKERQRLLIAYEESSGEEEEEQ